MPPKKPSDDSDPKETEGLEDVPPNQVGESVQDYIDSGIAALSVKRQPDGNYSISPG